MATLATPGPGGRHDPLLPQPAGATGPALSLALLAHAALIAALALGTQWRTSTPTPVSAELWASLPQVAAPRPATAPEVPAPAPQPVPQPVPPAPAPAPVPAPPPPPPPVAAPAPAPPPDPQIAIEQQRRERQAREQQQREQQAAREREQREQREAQQARQRAEAAAVAERQRQQAVQRERQQREERQRAEAEARERAAEEARLAQQRDAALRRIMGQAGASGAPSATGTAARDGAPSAAYAGRLVAHIRPHIVFPGSLPGNPEAVVEVRSGPAGTVIARRLATSSGHREWDEAVLRAIDRAGNLPRDADGRVPAVIVISFRPQD